jgi:hypothetical protein
MEQKMGNNNGRYSQTAAVYRGFDEFTAVTVFTLLYE